MFLRENAWLKETALTSDQYPKPKIEGRSLQIAKTLDYAFEIPGTKIRLGLDGILGLIPGIGDAFTTVLASAIVIDAANAGVPKATILQMIFNILVDILIGSIPLLGDIGDFFWRANEKNIRLWQNAHPDGKRDTVFLVFVAMCLLGLVLLCVFAVWRLLAKLFA
ncbi:MAG: DUF4112 domain-containing protein [Pseudobacteriovorax sp.]|nr:DUF4112 domain-containing protein [Pseudobacteriovorax sp.]